MRAPWLCGLVFSTALAAHADTIAPTPPMGWNSWDAYGLTIGEVDFKANAAVLAAMKSQGWSYAVIDEGWYMNNPMVEKLDARDYQLDVHGLLVPAVNRFPSWPQMARASSRWATGSMPKVSSSGFIVRGIPKMP